MNRFAGKKPAERQIGLKWVDKNKGAQMLPYFR